MGRRKDGPFITSLRSGENVTKYIINGRRYEFIIIKLDDNGVPYGHCYKSGTYAWLYPDSIKTDDGKVIEAIKIQ